MLTLVTLLHGIGRHVLEPANQAPLALVLPALVPPGLSGYIIPVVERPSAREGRLVGWRNRR